MTGPRHALTLRSKCQRLGTHTLSLCVSITRWYCTKTAKYRITQKCCAMAQGIRFFDAKDLDEIRIGSASTGVPDACGVGKNMQLLTHYSL